MGFFNLRPDPKAVAARQKQRTARKAQRQQGRTDRVNSRQAGRVATADQRTENIANFAGLGSDLVGEAGATIRNVFGTPDSAPVITDSGKVAGTSLTLPSSIKDLTPIHIAIGLGLMAWYRS